MNLVQIPMDDARELLKLLDRVPIKGSEAMRVVALQANLVRALKSPIEAPPQTAG